MKQNTLWLHAGGSKTGSSALQNFFAQHAIELEKHDFAYKNAIFEHDVQITSGNGQALFDYLENNPSREDLCEYILDFFGDCANAIISSEFFQYLSGQQISLLSTATSSVNIQFKIIFFVRNPSSFFISAYDQLIKRHGEWRTVDEWLPDNKVFDHVFFLRAVTQVLPKSQIHVMHYESVSKNLIDVMLKTLRLDKKISAVTNINRKKIVNRSLTHSERKLMILANKKLGEQYSTELSDLLIYQSPDLTTEAVTLSQDSIDLLITRFQDDVDWVNAQFFNSQPILAIEAAKSNNQVRRNTQEFEPTDPALTVLNWALDKISCTRQDAINFILNALTRAAEGDLVNQNQDSVPDDFNSVNYLILNSDVLYAGFDARRHYINYGAIEGRRYKFDSPYQDTDSQTITVPVNIKSQPVSITIRIDVSAQN